MLSLFPNLDQDLSTVSNAQRLFSVWDARNAKVSKSLKNTEYLSRLIGNQHPITAIESALKGDQPTRGMLKLFRSIKGDFEEPAKKAMAEAMINRAFINSGGTGGFVNAKAFYQSFYEPMSDNPSVTMMSLLKSQGILDTDQVRQIDYISKQLIKLEIAESAGNLIKNGQFNEQLLGEVGPLFEFFVTISGSALGTNVGKTLTGGQPGPGSITMAGKGANFLRNLLIKLPASENLNLVTELFTNKQLFLNFLKKPKSDKEKLQIQKNIVSILTKGVNTIGIDKAVKITPSVIRETGEDDDELTDETREFLERRDQSSVEPSIQTGIPTTQVASRQPFLSGLNTAPAGGGGSSAASAPTDRSKYASLFPNDIISGMIPTATMADGGAVQYMRNGGASMDMGLESSLSDQQTVQGGLDPYGDSGSDFVGPEKPMDPRSDIAKIRNQDSFKTQYMIDQIRKGNTTDIQYDKDGNLTGVYSREKPSMLESLKIDPLESIMTALVPGAGLIKGIGDFFNTGPTYTGYDPKITTQENINDGNDYNPLIKIATDRLKPVVRRTAASLYNQNPNQYTLNVSGINSLRNR